MAHAIGRAPPQRKATPEDIARWAKESGMGDGKRADALGDEPTEWSDEGLSDIDAVVAKAEKEDRSLRGSVY